MSTGFEIRNRTLGWVENLLTADGPIRNYDGQHQVFLHDRIYGYLFVPPMIAVPIYLLMVFFLPGLIKKEVHMKPILAVWNSVLTVASIIVFLCWSSTLIAELVKSGYSIHHIVCMPHMELNYGLNMVCATIYAVFKFFELTDTLFLILRKRPVPFLHWYHHATVLVYSWYAVMISVPVGNLFGVMNAFVHSIMYFYYFLSSVGQRPSWGKYITILQIVQMILGLTFTFAWSYFHVTRNDCVLVKSEGIPADDNIFMTASLLLYGSYFILFLRLYLSRFTGEEDAKRVDEKKNK